MPLHRTDRGWKAAPTNFKEEATSSERTTCVRSSAATGSTSLQKRVRRLTRTQPARVLLLGL